MFDGHFSKCLRDDVPGRGPYEIKSGLLGFNTHYYAAFVPGNGQNGAILTKSELWVAVETSMRVIWRGGGAAMGVRGAKIVECLKRHILGRNGSLASLEVNKRSFAEVIRNMGGHIRRRKFNWSTARNARMGAR